MATVKWKEFALARSGDKGDGSNVGIFVQNEVDYEFIREHLTPERVKAHFAAICKGEVTRFEAPNMFALNFLLSDSLGGGGSESLLTDAQGKTHGLALLLMEVVVPPRFKLPQVGLSGALAPAGEISEPSSRRGAIRVDPCDFRECGRQGRGLLSRPRCSRK